MHHVDDAWVCTCHTMVFLIDKRTSAWILRIVLGFDCRMWNAFAVDMTADLIFLIENEWRVIFEGCLGKWSADCAECGECKLRWSWTVRLRRSCGFFDGYPISYVDLGWKFCKYFWKRFFVKWRLSVDCCWVGGRIPLTGNFEWNQDGEMISTVSVCILKGKKKGGGMVLSKRVFKLGWKW